MRAPLFALALLACSDDNGHVDQTADAATDSAVETTAPDSDAATPTSLTLSIVSGRPDMVTGNAMLVRIDGDSEGLTLALDGDPVTPALHGLAGDTLALVDGVTDGPHPLSAARGDDRGAIDVVVHPIVGPVFSGPHETPYVCNTVASALGPPLDDDCSANPVTVYFRKTAAGTFEPLADPDAPPADTPTATTLHGQVAVPFVIRLEAKTINRAIAWIASLYDPDLPTPSPWQRASTWDGGVIYVFGGGCGTGHVQGDPLYGAAGNDIVGAGFVLVHSSLNTLGNNCNDVLSAETVMMVEEDFIERYGKPDYVMGYGGSGGSIQQHLIADDYPGLLDGLLPLASFPDVWSIIGDVMDCKLLYAYFGANPELWPSEAERTAVTGFAKDATCQGWLSILTNVFDPQLGCLSGVSPDDARCTLQDHNVNIFGTDPDTGFARRAWGNAGIEYGLGALESGAITVEQFVHLNEHVGGLDIDGQPTAARTEPDHVAVATAYRTGRILDGARLTLPMIDLRAYGDIDPGDFHDAVRTWATRARLEAHGRAANHVSFMAPATNQAALGQASLDALVAMDAWLRTGTKPVGDRCYLSATPTEGTCKESLVPHATPRMVAGGPLAGDNIACALVPLDDDAAFSEEQRTRLAEAFPTGVCDWSVPSPDRVPHAGAWQRY